MASTESHAGPAEDLCRVARLFGERQWCLATSGNLSARLDSKHCIITQSGKDKTRLSVNDLMVCDFDGVPADTHLEPSAETALHTGLYRLNPGISAVLHTHSVMATVISRAAGREVEFAGFEMQKALAGVRSHNCKVVLPVFDNSQDIPALADEVRRRAADAGLVAPGLLVRGHGLYAWGSSIAEAQRHIECFEFLLACSFQERLLPP